MIKSLNAPNVGANAESLMLDARADESFDIGANDGTLTFNSDVVNSICGQILEHLYWMHAVFYVMVPWQTLKNWRRILALHNVLILREILDHSC